MGARSRHLGRGNSQFPLPDPFRGSPAHRGDAEADAIGDPSLLRDGLTGCDRTALETYRDARAAIALIREAVEDCVPPGSVPRADYLTPRFTDEAEALVHGIYTIAGRSRRASRHRSSG